jgi:hypothetical protein
MATRPIRSRISRPFDFLPSIRAIQRRLGKEWDTLAENRALAMLIFGANLSLLSSCARALEQIQFKRNTLNRKGASDLPIRLRDSIVSDAHNRVKRRLAIVFDHGYHCEVGAVIEVQDFILSPDGFSRLRSGQGDSHYNEMAARRQLTNALRRAILAEQHDIIRLGSSRICLEATYCCGPAAPATHRRDLN